uniref:hypothetical protein n=1 Tax=Actinoplanes sp. CA-084688 TaxID=3239901 RepID=UPI003F494A18
MTGWGTPGDQTVEALGLELKIAQEPTVQALGAFMQELRMERGNPSFRMISNRLAHHSGRWLSTSTAWRIFKGRFIPTMEYYMVAAQALRASEPELEQVRQLWLAAARRVATLREELRATAGSPTADSVDLGSTDSGSSAGKIVIHAGEVRIDDGSITTGKVVEIHGGTVTLGPRAVQAAGGITVYGGTVLFAGGTDGDEVTDAAGEPPRLRRVQ